MTRSTGRPGRSEHAWRRIEELAEALTLLHPYWVRVAGSGFGESRRTDALGSCAAWCDAAAIAVAKERDGSRSGVRHLREWHLP